MASLAASIAPISILMLTINQRPKKPIKLLNIISQAKLMNIFEHHTSQPLATVSGGLQRHRAAADGTVLEYFNFLQVSDL